MRYQVQRLFWVGLAISPVITLSGAPLGLPQVALSAATSGLGSIAAFAAALTNFTHTKAPEREGLGLLRRSALRAPPPDLPDAGTRRALVSVALRSGSPEDVAEPPSRKTAMVRMLRRAMEAAGRQSLADLTPADTTELVLLKRLMRASPAQAGALAQLFERPDVVLDLRDEFLALGLRRDAYDRDKAALLATQTLWEQGQHHFGSMVQACLALNGPDVDLWHQIVQNDPLSPQAEWCVSQPACDRATVGIYMAHVARGNVLLKAIEAGDKARIDRLRAILKRWCAGGYVTSDLALTRADLDGDPTQVLSATLDKVAALLEEPRWTEPCGLFTLNDGRLPRDRSHWDLDGARLIRPPDSAAYIEAHLF